MPNEEHLRLHIINPTINNNETQKQTLGTLNYLLTEDKKQSQFCYEPE